MTQAHKTPGNIVRLHDKCFQAPYSPYYDYLKDRHFEVIGMEYPGHIKIREVYLVDSTEPPLELIIHDDELCSAEPSIIKKMRKNQQK